MINKYNKQNRKSSPKHEKTLNLNLKKKKQKVIKQESKFLKSKLKVNTIFTFIRLLMHIWIMLTKTYIFWLFSFHQKFIWKLIRNNLKKKHVILFWPINIAFCLCLGRSRLRLFWNFSKSGRFFRTPRLFRNVIWHLINDEIE